VTPAHVRLVSVASGGGQGQWAALPSSNLLIEDKTQTNLSVRNNYAMDMSLCHRGVLIEHKCVCESRRVHVHRVGACCTIVESGREREFVPPQPLVVWG
jgi:hypothetical protein